MTPNEKKLLFAMLEHYSDIMGNAVCNDLPREWEAMLTKEEWVALDRQFHEWNGDPENHDPNRIMMMDFSVLYYFQRRLKEELE